jgi:hypothetical protein
MVNKPTFQDLFEHDRITPTDFPAATLTLAISLVIIRKILNI